MEATATGTPGTIAKAGAPTVATPAQQKVDNPSNDNQNAGTDNGTDGKAADDKTGAQAGAAGTGGQAGDGKTADEGQEGKAGEDGKAGGEATKNEPPAITEDQLKEYLAKQGIEGITDLNHLKGLVEKGKAPAPEQLTPEQQAAAQQEYENKMLKMYLDNGGKAEDFVAVKTLMGADVKDLSISELKRELKAEGFTDDQIPGIIAERYYAIDATTLVQGEDESADDFAKRKELATKKATYGSKKLDARSKRIIEDAKSTYNSIKKAVEDKELLERQEAEFVSKVDTIAKNYPRSITVELGKVDDQEIPPVQYTVAEEDMAEVTAILKDPAKRNQIFFNSDNGLNLDNVVKLLLHDKIFKSAVKASLLEGGDRQVKAYEKKFGGRSAHDIGVGGKVVDATKAKGQVAKAGQPQIAVRQQ